MLREVEGGWALELAVAMVTTDDDAAVVTVLLVSACLSPGLRLSMSQITHRINIRKSGFGTHGPSGADHIPTHCPTRYKSLIFLEVLCDDKWLCCEVLLV